MQQSHRRVAFFVLALIGLFWILVSRPASAAAGPQALYQRAWQLVHDVYVDPTFNHQNWEAWHHKFDGKLENDQQAYAAIKEMLASLDDPYTRFLDPKAFQEENDAINSYVCGIGISLRPYTETHALIVNDVIEGGPAARAGIEYGDQIVAINGQSCREVNTDQAAEKIRGAAGSTVALKVKHGDQQRDLTITRAQVCIPSVITKTLDHNVGYIKLTTFMADDASGEFRSALQAMAGKNGLIIDLRNNPGGLLANAVEIADMLLDHGKIVTTASRHGSHTDACTGGQITEQPIVLLVDQDSASASEILAGALKDNRRAVIVGTKTFGKGLVQEINRLPDGAGMHVTVARYYTPNGSDINKIGIAPDVVADGDRKQQLAKAQEVLEQQIAEHGSIPVGAAPGKRYGFEARFSSPRS